MNKTIAVSLRGIYKKFRRRSNKPTLAERVFKQKRGDFFALRDVNLVVYKGEKIGIIGENGAGKTTLLKIMGGISTPTSGRVKTNGIVVSLIELDAGFHPDLTGRENIYLNGLLIGMTKVNIKNNIDAIIAYAELNTFIDEPLYTYSSGMKLRLGLSIALHAKPDIILIDEGINVGDQWFKNKIRNETRLLFNNKITILMVSHNLYSIVDLCDKAIVLENGTIVYKGKLDAIKYYYKDFKYEYVPAPRRWQSKISQQLMQEVGHYG